MSPKDTKLKTSRPPSFIPGAAPGTQVKAEAEKKPHSHRSRSVSAFMYLLDIRRKEAGI